jgi:hypothetical protein
MIRSRILSASLTSSAGALVVLFVAGCNDRVEMAPVSGRVTMEGKAVRDVFVVFHPQPLEGSIEAPTRPAMGQVDDEGQHTVSIIAVDRNARPPGNVPPSYEVEVKPGANTHDLELKPSS